MSTAKELAQKLGVSVATISRALNGKPGLTEDLRTKILEEAARTKLSVNGAARALSTSRSDHVCVAVYHLPGPLSGDPFYSEILMGIEQELRNANKHLLLEVLGESEIKDPARWRVIRERRADGVILNGPFVPSSFILKLHTLGIPVVLIDNFVEYAPVDAVVCDDRVGAKALAEHIIKLGHRKVVVLSGPQDWYSNQERCGGFSDAFAHHQLSLPKVLNSEATTYETGQALMKEALKLKPTAVLCVNDAMAMGASEVATAAGLNIPKDLSITGFDDVPTASRWLIPLTTTRVPKEYLGRAAARQLLTRIADPEAPQQRISVATSLVVRASSGPKG